MPARTGRAPDEDRPNALVRYDVPAVRLSGDGTILVSNPAFDHLAGYARGALTGAPLADLLGPETEPASVRELTVSLRQRVPFLGELFLYRQTGSPFWCDLSLVPVGPDESLALFRDVTARRTAESALDLRAAHDRMVLDRIQAGIVVHRATTEILYANAKAMELLGVSHDAILGAVNTDPRWSFIGADGALLPIEEYPVGRAVRTRAIVRDLLLGLTRDSDHRLTWIMCNAYPVLDDSGAATEVVVSFTDVTELKQTERALQKSEERLQLVLQGSRDAPWDWDIRSGETYYSPRWLEMVGYTAGDVATDGELWIRLTHEGDRDRVLRELQSLLAGTAQSYETEFRLMHRNGTPVQVLSRGFILRDSTGAAVRVSGTNTDVTEQRAIEGRLRQSQKMEAIGQLAGGVAHDFNNLLAVIQGNLELLRESLPSGATEPMTFVREGLRAAQRGAALTRRLLSFSRQQPLQPEPVELRVLVPEFADVLRRLIGERVAVTVDLDADLPVLHLDAALLENALLNLAINARDAMPDGGTLRLEARVVTGSEVPGAEAADSRQRFVRVTVRDSGSGMAPEVLAKACEPFFTTKPPGQGTGLGLSMVYGFVKQSGGHLTIQSSPGDGTAILLDFPVLEQVAPVSGPAAPLSRPRAPANATVLVVEDEPGVRRFILRSLASLGYQTREAPDGPTAMRILADGERVDVILTDLMMPGGMTGQDLVAAWRRQDPDVGVVLMSGYTDDVVQQSGVGVLGPLLTKPFSVDELAVTLARVLRPTESGA